MCIRDRYMGIGKKKKNSINYQEMAEKKLRVFRLRTKTPEELTKQLEELKKELAQMRVAKVSGGTASKLGRIKILRKSIAKYLTVMNEQNLKKVREMYKGKKYKPLNIRHKKTRAIRRKLTKKQQNAEVLRVQKKKQNFPLRKFALRE
eukprot:TRINITY_DN440_c0_g1_i9.p2 TRINITY_DN440_c0_g1~~TRINITY_DN440_c0_g1_i9.p2  ORF type:complete len:148 (+),score=29.78 TRINITY_DN440_c0_g1_i9:166-609(+)